MAYFEAFAETFQLRHLIRLGTRVTRLQPISWDWDSSPKRFPLSHPSNSVANGWALSHDARTTAAALQPTHLEAASRWRVCSERTSGSGDGDGDAAVMDGRHSGGSRAEEFDAVVSCVGNYRCGQLGVGTLPRTESKNVATAAACSIGIRAKSIRLLSGNQLGFSVVPLLTNAASRTRRLFLGWTASQASKCTAIPSGESGVSTGTQQGAIPQSAASASPECFVACHTHTCNEFTPLQVT